MISKVKKLLKNNVVLLLFSSSSLLKAFIIGVTGIIFLKWIEPEDIGLWQSVYTLTVYLPIIQIGVNNGLNRQLPLLFGKQEIDKAYEFSRSALSYNLFVVFVVFIISLVIASLLIILEVNTRTIITFVVVSFLICSSLYNNYLIVTYRNNDSFKNLSKVYIIECLFLITLVPLIKKFGYYGLLLYYLTDAVIFTVTLHRFRPLKINPLFNKLYLKELVKIGLPIYFIGYIISISKTIPRIVLIFFDNVVMVGLYAPASAIMSMMLMIPNTLAQFIYPKMSYKYGKTNSVVALWSIVWKSSFYPAIITVPVALISFFFLPYLIKEYFPKYILSIGCAQWTVMSSIFVGSLISSNVLYSISKYMEAFLLSLTRLFLFLVLPTSFYFYNNQSLTSLGFGIFLASAIIFVINQIALFYIIKKNETNR